MKADRIATGNMIHEETGSRGVSGFASGSGAACQSRTFRQSGRMRAFMFEPAHPGCLRTHGATLSPGLSRSGLADRNNGSDLQ